MMTISDAGHNFTNLVKFSLGLLELALLRSYWQHLPSEIVFGHFAASRFVAFSSMYRTDYSSAVRELRVI